MREWRDEFYNNDCKIPNSDQGQYQRSGVLWNNETLEPGFPRKISVETARNWLHKLGFEVLTAKKGCFVDGHERADVVEYR